MEFPAELNGGEPCTIRFAWWGGQTRHERTEAVVKMFMEKYPNVTVEMEPSDFDVVVADREGRNAYVG